MIMRGHKLEELVPDDDEAGFVVIWVCDCGARGRARTQPSALEDWHAHSQKRDYSWCKIIS